MARHPFSRYWKGVIACIVAGAALAGVLLWNQAFLLGIGVLLCTGVGVTIYLLGESSDLPGTAGDGNRDVPTDVPAGTLEKTDVPPRSRSDFRTN